MNTAINPLDLIPKQDPFGLPAPVWVFVLLMNLTLAVHFLFMGYAFTAALFDIFFAAAAREGSPAEWMLRRTERPLPVALSFAITFGVAPLLFVQVLYQQVFYAANIILGYQWIGIVAVVIAAFYTIYLVQGGRLFGRRIPRGCDVAGRVFIFACLLYVMTTLTTNALLTMHPERWLAVRAAGGNTFVLGMAILAPRLVHNALAALIIGSLWLVTLGLLSAGAATADRRQRECGRALARLGALVGAVAVMLQMLAGLGLAIADYRAVRQMLVSLRPAAILWAVALLAVLALWAKLIFLLAAAKKSLLVAAWGALVVILSGMFAAREAVRQIVLAPYLTLERWTVHPQLSSLALFLILFVAALGLVALMLRWAAQTPRRPEAP